MALMIYHVGPDFYNEKPVGRIKPLCTLADANWKLVK